MADQDRLFLTELRLCGESDHWRINAHYTAAIKEKDTGDAPAGKDASQEGKEKKASPPPEEITLSMLLPAGDRSVVDLQVAAIDRAIAFLQATVNAARAEQGRHDANE